MSMSGGKSSGSNSSSTFSPYAPILAQFGKTALPLYKELSSQAGEALRTGGINAQIPLINRSLDEARGAFSKSFENTRQALARTGLGKSGFGQSMLADLGMQGENAVSQIPTNVASQFIAGIPGLAGQGIGALGAAMGGNISSHGSGSMSSFGWGFDPSSFFKDLGQGAVAAGGTGGGGGPGGTLGTGVF